VWPVEIVELLGSEMLVHAGRRGEASLTLKIANGATVGDAIHVSFPATHLHVFDRATGLRLEATRTGPAAS
jgi:sn-glycerol 3-phosphate transport system ATP-binding protein